MWRRTLTAASIVIATTTISLAAARTIRNFKVANWYAGAYTEPASNRFDHCAANAPYKSGIIMGFSIDRYFHWSMRFTHPAWRLVRGQRFNVAFTVDNMSPLPGVGIALSRDTLEVPLADSMELFSRFRHGYQLHVAAARQVFGFNLTGTSELLPELLICAKNRGRAIQVDTNPFAPRLNPPTETAANRGGEGAEATAFAANLLSLAGVQGFRMLPPADHPELKGDARWVSGSTYGTVNIFASATDDEIKSLSGSLIGADAKACKGAFFSGAIPDKSSGVVARVFTTCQAGDKPITVYYLAVPRRSGGVYVISTVSFGSEQPAKRSSEELRSGVAKYLANYEPGSKSSN
jgi:hypothetical protein